MKINLDKLLPNRVLLIRQEHSLSQQQMADILNVSKTYYNRLENGTRKMNTLQIDAIAKRFSVDSDELVALGLVDQIESLLEDVSEKVVFQAMSILNNRIK